MPYNPVSTYRIQFHKEFSFEKFEAVMHYLRKLGIKTIYASPLFKAVAGSLHGYDVLDPQQVNPEIGSLSQLKNIIHQLDKWGIGWLQDIVPNHMAFDMGNHWLMDVLENGEQSDFKDFFDIDWSENIHDGKLMVPFLNSSLDEALEKNEIKLVFENNRYGLKYFNQVYPLRPESVETISQLTGTLDRKSSITKINSSHSWMKKIMEEQHYICCHWQEVNRMINYRRFFIVNELICLNMQYEKVFNDYHDLIFSLTRQNYFKGLRVDHIDGLYEPTAYLKWLKEKAGEKTLIVVEKILGMEEKLPVDWKVEGTTGYDFLTWINNLFTNDKKLSVLKNYYEELTGETLDMEREQTRKKALILYEYMGGELDNLFRLLLGLIRMDQLTCSAGELKTAIGEFLVHLPVYRLYAERLPLTGEDAKIIEEVFDKIINSGRATESAVNFLRQLFLTSQPSEDSASHALHFFKRCMQFTGPLMAKGVEDTWMYSCNYFIGHNEVGDSPANDGISKGAFHRAMIERQQKFPFALNATSTHDTKRGEDARARLNVITDFADEWIAKVKEWRKICEPFKENNIPDASEEYFIYQTLIAVYPGLATAKDFEQRVHAYLEKALREAKINSSWVEPNLDYENKVKQFATVLLNAESDFGKSFFPFQKKIAELGAINSLAQLVLKFTCPGIPDIYQGCELWDLSLVDPDNRRPVDFKKRMALLDEIDEHENDVDFLSRLWQDHADGKIKLWLTKKIIAVERKVA